MTEEKPYRIKEDGDYSIKGLTILKILAYTEFLNPIDRDRIRGMIVFNEIPEPAKQWSAKELEAMREQNREQQSINKISPVVDKLVSMQKEIDHDAKEGENENSN